VLGWPGSGAARGMDGSAGVRTMGQGSERAVRREVGAAELQRSAASRERERERMREGEQARGEGRGRVLGRLL
jgi:hypothetical protein